MENETQVETTEEVLPTETETTEETQAPSQEDPVAVELARVQTKESGRTKRDKLEYTKARVESQLAELDAEEGVTPTSTPDKSAPMTVAMYEQMERERGQKTALQLADEISDANERELTKHHIENTIRPSGNPNEDLRLARAIVNSVKNGQIAQEVSRATPAPRSGTAPGAPAIVAGPEAQLSAEEMSFMRPPFSLSKEQIIASRPK